MAALTVLMPVYNSERFLAEAIDSILNQTFADFEFLIIDDCSTDNSVSIIKSYSDRRIRFYQNQINLGISPTLNKGIELAKTELIARMDSDDVSYPERLQKQYDFIAANPDGALYSCWVRVIDQENQFIRFDDFNSNYYYYNLTFICWIYHPTIIFTKTAVQEVGMYSVPYSEDFELFWQLSRKYKIYNLSDVLLDYRVTDQSLHHVLRKEEYKKAQKEQLLRNFRYYAGIDYNIPDSFIDCLQHNFQPLLEENSVSKVIACVRELEFLTQQILAKENANRNPEAIKTTAFFKRRFIVMFFAENLSPPKGILLLIRLRENAIIKRKIKDAIKKIFRLKRQLFKRDKTLL
ncbi:MAG TPA: glycosyltransferase [Mucilaginibacter sp.]|jgi:glycosyltransferase involved in cell wall biosynthesis